MDIVKRKSRSSIETVSKTLVANNTTVSVGLFRVTGCVKIKKLWGIVTTVLGSNHTAAHWRLEDGTNTPEITLATGTTLSSFVAGSQIQKKGLAGAAIVANQADQVRISEHATSGMDSDTPFDVVQKAATNSDIVYRYTTTNAPTTGAIQFFCEWEPKSAGANVVGI